MPILNSLYVIFHRSLCKFGGNLVSKLGLILYIDLTSLKQQFLISLPKTSNNNSFLSYYLYINVISEIGI